MNMGTMIDTIENAITTEPEVDDATNQADDFTAEEQLADEISTLWGNHVRLSGDRRTTAKELRLIRARLAERLFEMKQILSRPDAGRGGQWRSWLLARHIPRSTADRLVTRHAETLDTHSENVPTEAIPEPSERDVQRLFASLWPGLRKKLTTPESAYAFIRCFVYGFSLTYKWQEEGILVFEPGFESSSADTAARVLTEEDAGDEDSGEEV
jgi:hypothetical protein